MGLKVVSMEELKLEVVLEPQRTGDSVAEVCRRHGISRETFYVYRRRYLAEGLAGLEPRSRRPRCSPGRVEAELEARICRLRKDHPRWGGRRTRVELRRVGIEPPATSTIHRALERTHLVAPQPPRPPQATKRFERELANDLWQIDGTRVLLASGRPAWIVDCLDDHARFLLAALAGPSPSGEAAWPASRTRPPPTGSRASSSPTTTRASPIACSGSRSSSSASSPGSRSPREKSPAYPPHSLTRKVNRNGIFSYQGLGIILPYRYAGATVRVVAIGELLHVYLGQELVRVLALDRTRRYQKLGKQERRN
jgi:transposase-like protein